MKNALVFFANVTSVLCERQYVLDECLIFHQLVPYEWATVRHEHLGFFAKVKPFLRNAQVFVTIAQPFLTNDQLFSANEQWFVTNADYSFMSIS